MDFFLNPERILNLLWLIPLMVLIYVWAARRRKKALSALLGSCHQAPDGGVAGVNVRAGMRVFRFCLLLLGLCFLVLTWAHPAWGTRLFTQGGAGRDIMVFLDVSRSMLAGDVPPSRLEHAKMLIAQVAEGMPGDRFGLISFAGSAFMECPLTVDRISFTQILNMVNEKAIPVGGTNVEKALQSGLEHFKESLGGHRAFLLISDGEEQTGNMAATLDALRKAEIPVLTVGIGDPQNGSVIQVTDENGRKSFITDAKGDVVKTRLNEAGLKQLATATQGVYIHTGISDMGEKAIIDYLKKLTPEAHEDSARMLPIERWPWFLSAALFFFILWLCLSESDSQRSVRDSFQIMMGSSQGWIIGSILWIGMVDSLQASENADSIRASSPTPISLYNDGVDLQSTQPEAAAEKYQAALAVPNADPEVRHRANMNLGADRHQVAQNFYEQAEGAAQIDPDSALVLLKKAENEMNEAETFYREALQVSRNESSPIRNQQRLLNDQTRTKELQKAIEEYKKQMEEAQKQAQQAQESQQKANQAGKDHPSDKAGDQFKANEQTQQANESVQKAQEAAKKMKNKPLESQAEAVKSDLDKAQQAQEKNNTKAAQKHLDDAVQKLKAVADEKKKADEEKTNQEKGGKSEEQKDGKPSEKDKSVEESTPQNENMEGEKQEDSAGNEAETEEKKEGQAAEMLLREMSKDEQKLREAVLKTRFPGHQPKVEKDW